MSEFVEECIEACWNSRITSAKLKKAVARWNTLVEDRRMQESMRVVWGGLKAMGAVRGTWKVKGTSTRGWRRVKRIRD